MHKCYFRHYKGSSGYCLYHEVCPFRRKDFFG